MNTVVEKQTMTLTRFIAAPAERLWQCWTDPDILPRWFGPEGFSCQTKEIDLREGGQWRFDMIGPDGKVWPNRHRFTLFERLRRIEFLMDGDDDAGQPMQVVVTMTPEAAGTRYTQVMTFPSVEMFQGAKAMGAQELGETTLNKLERVATS